jgi:hypothetical protein
MGWEDDYQSQRARKMRDLRMQTALFGYASGQAIGSVMYVINTGRVTPAALGAGAFLGVVLAAGSVMRTF